MLQLYPCTSCYEMRSYDLIMVQERQQQLCRCCNICLVFVLALIIAGEYCDCILMIKRYSQFILFLRSQWVYLKQVQNPDSCHVSQYRIKYYHRRLYLPVLSCLLQRPSLRFVCLGAHPHADVRLALCTFALCQHMGLCDTTHSLLLFFCRLFFLCIALFHPVILGSLNTFFSSSSTRRHDNL